MLLIVLGVATVLAVFWLVLLGLAETEDWRLCAYNKVFDNLLKMERLCEKHAARKKMPENATWWGRALFGGGPEKKVSAITAQNERLSQGDLKNLGIFDMPGYVALRKFAAIGKSGLHKKILSISLELYGKKHAENKSKQLLARLVSYPIVGVASALSLGAAILGLGNVVFGTAALIFGPALALVLAYSNYDELCDKANKRKEAIVRQFPGVASKLALLSASGMIIQRAWKETAYSENLELYREMQKTSDELDNLIGPEEAYGDFVSRCNTKETSKLAAAITQNLSKGNAELTAFLKSIAREAWVNRRHNAKRETEKANSKLMIPTMLLFLAILFMIMAPLIMNFSKL